MHLNHLRSKGASSPAARAKPASKMCQAKLTQVVIESSWWSSLLPMQWQWAGIAAWTHVAKLLCSFSAQRSLFPVCYAHFLLRILTPNTKIMTSFSFNLNHNRGGGRSKNLEGVVVMCWAWFWIGLIGPPAPLLISRKTKWIDLTSYDVECYNLVPNVGLKNSMVVCSLSIMDNLRYYQHWW